MYYSGGNRSLEAPEKLLPSCWLCLTYVIIVTEDNRAKERFRRVLRARAAKRTPNQKRP